MTDRTDILARLRAELEGAFRNRADLYRLFFHTLKERLGPAEAEAIMVEAVEERGREVARLAFSGFGANDAKAIGEAFLAASPDGGRMYPTDVERREDGIAFRVRRCPLKDAWTEAGMHNDELATMCRIAGAFDRGLFETTGVRFSNRTWKPGDGARCCIIALTNAASTGPGDPTVLADDNGSKESA